MDQGMELKGCVYRIKNCAVELLSMEEEYLMTGADEDSWDLVGRDLRLKVTFLYIDLSRVISCYDGQGHKNALSDLANKLFCSMDELGDAVKSRSVPLTRACYNDTADALREVVASLQLGAPDLEE